jgi:alanyl-tRNA synthetase
VNEASGDIESLASGGITVEGCRIVTARVDASDIEELKSLGDSLRSKLTSGVGVLGAVIGDKVALVCVVTDDLIKAKKLEAGKIVGEIAKITGGGGGGRPHLATAGGKDVAKLDEALGQSVAIVSSMLGR